MAHYTLSSAKRLNEHFYAGLDEAFLFSKAFTLYEVAQRHDDFLSERSDDEAASTLDRGKFKEALLAEIHFSEFVQFEALFALLLAIFQELPHWLYLTTYRTYDVKRLVGAFIQSDVAQLTNGQLSTVEEFYNHSLYAGYVGSKDGFAKPWQENIDNIHWLLTNMANRYLHAEDFNAYKHGLRVHTGHTALKIVPSDGSRGLSLESDNSLAYLELKPEPDGTKRVFLATKHFNPLEALNNLHVMRIMLATIKRTRMARLKGEPEAQLNTFFEINRDDLNGLKERTKWTFSI